MTNKSQCLKLQSTNYFEDLFIGIYLLFDHCLLEFDFKY